MAASANTDAPASSMFGNADGYERIMGRWSRRLAPLLIEFGGLSDGDRVLDVGCGTGSLTFALSQFADIAAAAGIDTSEGYLEHARSRNTDNRIGFEHADARALPFADNSFDRAFSLLVLQFVPDPARAVAEMQRVVRPGGTVAAAVWDDVGGLPHTRMLFDIAAVLDRSVKRPYFRPLSGPGQMAEMWRATGLTDVAQTSLLIRMDFESFDDYWAPFTTGEGPPGQLLAGLADASRAALQDHVRHAYLAGQPDGPRSFAAVAWACRGTVPE